MGKKKKSKSSTKEMIAALKSLMPYISSHKFSMAIVIIALLISTVISVSVGFGLRYVFDKFPTDPVAGAAFLDEVLMIVISIIIVSMSVGFISSYVLQKVATQISEKIRCDVFSNIVSQNLAYIEQQNSGDIQTRIVADTNSVGRFLTMQVPVIFSAILSLVGGGIGALLISTKLTLYVLACAPLIFLPFLVLAKKLRYLGQMVQAAIADVGRFSGEAFRNIRVMKAYNKEEQEKQKFSSYAAKTSDYTIRSMRLSLIVNRVVSSIALIAASVLLWRVANDIYFDLMTIGQLLAFVYFARLIVSSAQEFVGVVTSVNVIVGKAKIIIGYLRTERLSWPTPVGDFQVKGKIDFSGLIFNYPSRPNIQVLKGVDLTVEAGSHVAIVGPSGAGKSTLFDLLLKLYDTQQGTIYIDGVDFKDLGVEQLRAFIGFVPQKESLISGTVFDNISYGTTDADMDIVKEAAAKAHADEFIQQLPEGYDTDLGEVASRLSGGQKQRLSLARALVRNPQILLLDEANSALDTESDRQVTKAIKEWAKNYGRTVIAIAHRLSSARQADMIIVMENGTVVGKGTHDELVKSSKVYRNLAFPGLEHPEDIELEAV